MLRISVLALAIVFMVGCGGGLMPSPSPTKTGLTGSGTSSSGSGTGTSSSGSGSGTSSSGSGTGTSSSGSGSGTSSSGSGSGTSSSGSGSSTSSSGSGSGTSSSGSGSGTSSSGSGSGTSSSGSGSGTSSSGSGSGTSSSGSGSSTSSSGSGSGTSSSGSGSGSSSGSGSGTSSGGSSDSTAVVGPSQFTLWGYTWNTHGGSAPRVGNVNGNVGTFDPNHVSVGSELVLTLTQTQQGSQILSVGAEVQTQQTFTSGTFEFTSRVSNVASGSDASGFLYATNSITEIDMEQVGNKVDAVDCTNWKGLSDFQDTQVFGYDQGNSHTFKILWQSTHVDWYVDGTLVVSHTQAVPSAVAPFLFNLWGTNNSSWGGTASPGVTRYMHITNFKYTP